VNAPDTTKTELVEDALINGETATSVMVTLNPSKHAGETWIVTVDYGWAQTNVALCDYPHHAHGVALALSGAMDCDLVLGDDLEAALA
jgi:hypothetical protein